jgi:2'-5' RNA ligase superfamily
MAHSVELLFDPDTEEAIRRAWTALSDAELPSQTHHRSPSNRPHVTLSVSERIDPAVDGLLRRAAATLPLICRVGAPLLFGSERLTLVRLIVPSLSLLEFQRTVDATCASFMPRGAYEHSRPGQWTPHVTLCRRLARFDVPAALAAVGAGDVVGEFVALRRWDGDARIDTLLS